MNCYLYAANWINWFLRKENNMDAVTIIQLINTGTSVLLSIAKSLQQFSEQGGQYTEEQKLQIDEDIKEMEKKYKDFLSIMESGKSE